MLSFDKVGGRMNEKEKKTIVNQMLPHLVKMYPNMKSLKVNFITDTQIELVMTHKNGQESLFDEQMEEEDDY